LIYVKDNFLPKEVYESLRDYSEGFEKYPTPGKDFWVKDVPQDLKDYIVAKLENTEGNKIENILCFLREAKEGQDNDWRIHNDTAIMGCKPDRAIVLYIKSNEKDLHGTAFWEHKDYGYKYKESSSLEFDRMLIEEANNINNWKLGSVVGYKDNRLLSYPCEYFHSKYPKEYNNQRVVLVMFYKIIKSNERTETK
jgi:hypothetical protein